MLRLEMLPAGHGDCLWLEYGSRESPRRILIDGGAAGTYQHALNDRLRTLPESARCFELLVVTHIDADHLCGVLDLIEDNVAGFQARDCWFNGFRHLPDEAPDTLGPVQGEKFSQYLVTRPWNHAFQGAAAVCGDGQAPPRRELEGGLVLTLLSPTPAKLATLKPTWEAEVRKAGHDPHASMVPSDTEEGLQFLGAGPPDGEALAATRFIEDSTVANGSSIALRRE